MNYFVFAKSLDSIIVYYEVMRMATYKSKRLVRGLDIDENVENLAFAYFKYSMNEKIFGEGVITEVMYKFAKQSLQKDIDRLEKICYNSN